MATQDILKMPAHLFLASLGKTRLRPGGKEATDRIIEQCQLTRDSQVLEVAPNMGTTAIHIAQTYGCRITGIDLHQPSVKKAEEHIAALGLSHLISIKHGNALELPFPDESFDVVINEAMLSMLPQAQKEKAISEYYRVLKKGGRLVTHDLLLREELTPELLQQLRQTLRVTAHPLTAERWKDLFSTQPFSGISNHCGKKTLLTLHGLLVDEGLERTIQMLQRASNDEVARGYLFELVESFEKNEDRYGHITFCAIK